MPKRIQDVFVKSLEAWVFVAVGFREAGIKLKLKHPIGVLPLFRLQETPSHILKRKAAEMGQKLKRGCFFLNSGINKALAILTSALGADLGQF